MYSNVMTQKTISLYPAQFDFITCEDNLTGFVAGIGAGKTYAGAIKSAMYSNRPGLGMIVAPTYGMLRDSTLRTFLDLAGDAIVDEERSSMTLFTTGGGEILLRSADNPEKLRGPNLNWIWIDEGGLTKELTWQICIGRLRAGGKFGHLWVTTTPKGKRNWVYKVSKDMRIFRATTFDNPFTSKAWQHQLTQSYVDNFLRQEAYGEFVSFEGLVYPQFQPEHIVRRDISSLGDFELGVDEGYTNPAVVLKVYSDNDGGYHIAEEWYERGKLQSEHVSNVVRMADNQDPDIGVDSSARGLIAAIRDEGLRARGATGRVKQGSKTIQELLANGKITVDPSCIRTIAEFESYQWKPGTDEPQKENDHAMDASRYIINKKKDVPQKAQQRRY